MWNIFQHLCDAQVIKRSEKKEHGYKVPKVEKRSENEGKESVVTPGWKWMIFGVSGDLERTWGEKNKENECFRGNVTENGRKGSETRSRGQGKAKCFESVYRNARESNETFHTLPRWRKESIYRVLPILDKDIGSCILSRVWFVSTGFDLYYTLECFLPTTLFLFASWPTS